MMSSLRSRRVTTAESYRAFVPVVIGLVDTMSAPGTAAVESAARVKWDLAIPTG
jgi:hypothetical protein